MADPLRDVIHIGAVVLRMALLAALEVFVWVLVNVTFLFALLLMLLLLLLLKFGSPKFTISIKGLLIN